jgi:hypothetical protein
MTATLRSRFSVNLQQEHPNKQIRPPGFCQNQFLFWRKKDKYAKRLAAWTVWSCIRAVPVQISASVSCFFVLLSLSLSFFLLSRHLVPCRIMDGTVLARNRRCHLLSKSLRVRYPVCQCIAHPASYAVCAGVLWRYQSGRGVMLATQLHLTPRVRMRGETLLLSLRASVAWRGLYHFLTLNWRNSVQ